MWHKEHHPLAGTCQKHPIGILAITNLLGLSIALPTGSPECARKPAIRMVAKVSVLGDKRKVKFQPLHGKLRSDIFQLITRSNVVFPVKKPFGLVDFALHEETFRL